MEDRGKIFDWLSPVAHFCLYKAFSIISVLWFFSIRVSFFNDKSTLYHCIHQIWQQLLLCTVYLPDNLSSKALVCQWVFECIIHGLCVTLRLVDLIKKMWFWVISMCKGLNNLEFCLLWLIWNQLVPHAACHRYFLATYSEWDRKLFSL